MPTRRTRLVRIGAAVAGLAMIASACGGDDGETIRIYTGRHYDLEAAFNQFAEETGVSIEFLEGSDAELRERIAAEGEDTQADIYMTVDAGNLAIAAEQGIFQPIDSPTLDGAVPENLRDPDGQCQACELRARGFAEAGIEDPLTAAQ